jgi:hypothetical protein
MSALRQHVALPAGGAPRDIPTRTVTAVPHPCGGLIGQQPRSQGRCGAPLATARDALQQFHHNSSGSALMPARIPRAKESVCWGGGGRGHGTGRRRRTLANWGAVADTALRTQEADVATLHVPLSVQAHSCSSTALHCPPPPATCRASARAVGQRRELVARGGVPPRRSCAANAIYVSWRVAFCGPRAHCPRGSPHCGAWPACVAKQRPAAQASRNAFATELSSGGAEEAAKERAWGLGEREQLIDARRSHVWHEDGEIRQIN